MLFRYTRGIPFIHAEMAIITLRDRKGQLEILNGLLRKTKSTYETLVRAQELRQVEEATDTI